MIHAQLSASGAHRWMRCPGSVRLCKNIPHRDTKYTIEGTVAHTLAQMSLERNLPPSTWEGSSIDGIKVLIYLIQYVEG